MLFFILKSVIKAAVLVNIAAVFVRRLVIFQCRQAESGAEIPDPSVDIAGSVDYSVRVPGGGLSKIYAIRPAFEEAARSTKTPTIIEFLIDPEDLVYPMIQPGGTLQDMIMDC